MDTQQRGNQLAHHCGGSTAQLQKVLNIIFPPEYLDLKYKSLLRYDKKSSCSMLNIKCCVLRRSSRYVDQDDSRQTYGDDIVSLDDLIYQDDFSDKAGKSTWPDNDDYRYEVSTEPSSRSSVISLRQQLNWNLSEHQAKSVGLCPVRRSIYDQCFDELIRQVTVNCIEQGLLLFRIRNELLMTMKYYQKAYESGVNYGLNKAIEAEILINRSKNEVVASKDLGASCESDKLKNRVRNLEVENKLELFDRMKEYYLSEITKKDQIIEQQRNIIKALSQKISDNITSPM